MSGKVRERPIIFSGDSVRAILAGEKSQGRRIIRPQPDHLQRYEWKGKVLYDAEHRLWWWKEHCWDLDTEMRADLAEMCPYAPDFKLCGGRLWVRETWGHFGGDEYLYQQDQRAVTYRACHSAADPLDMREPAGGRWRSPIFMPRWASRLTLEVTGIRVERLQDISEEDARAEGCREIDSIAAGGQASAAQVFAGAWDRINGKRAPWRSNPFTWVVSFRRVMHNGVLFP